MAGAKAKGFCIKKKKKNQAPTSVKCTASQHWKLSNNLLHFAVASFSCAQPCSLYSYETTVAAVDCKKGLQGRAQNTKRWPCHTAYI